VSLDGTTITLITESRALSTRLLHGPVISAQRCAVGHVVMIPADEVVFYALQARHLRCFVFRTLRAPEPFSSTVPAVSHPVRLLLHTSTRGRLQKLEALLGYLKRVGRSPSSLSDAFYLRLHALLAGRLPRPKVLRSLLDSEEGDGPSA
jgi:hypothetical protein